MDRNRHSGDRPQDRQGPEGAAAPTVAPYPALSLRRTAQRLLRAAGTILPALAIALFAGAAQADRIIHTDHGGDVSKYLRDVKSLKQARTKTWVYGPCGSACTLYLGLGPLVCTTPRAKWQFHGPSAADGHTKLDNWVFELTSKMMAEQYPARLAQWFMATGRHRTGKHFYTLTGAEIIDYGVRACPRFTPQ